MFLTKSIAFVHKTGSLFLLKITNKKFVKKQSKKDYKYLYLPMT